MRLLSTGLTLVLCFVVLVLPSWAQETPTLEDLEISLWPEFDRADMLVIYRGSFDAGTSLPVPVEIRIPAGAGAPTAVAFVDEVGERFNQQYTTRLDGEAMVVSFELPSLGFQLEYYDVLARDADGQREYAYTYTADYPIEALTVKFQVPPTAEAYGVQPAVDSISPEADGLLYHVVRASSVDQGETRGWLVSYNKADSVLTESVFAQSQQSVAAPTAAPSSGDGSPAVVFVIAFVVLVGVGAGAFWLGRRTQPMPEEVIASSRRRSSSAGRRSARYCHKCGAQLRPDSDFCHICGAEVGER